MNEPIPHISFDINLGKYIEYIDVDYKALVAYMRKQKFDDEAIATTSIYFSAENTEETDSEGMSYFTFGGYKPIPGYIKVYMYVAVYVFNRLTVDLTDTDQIETIRSQLSGLWSKISSNTLNHEIEHQRLAPGLGLNPDKLNDLIEPFRPIGWTALRLQEYESRAVEIHCREVAAKGPKDIVHLQLKIHTDNQ